MKKSSQISPKTFAMRIKSKFLGMNSAVLILDQILKLRLSRCWNRIKIESILSKQRSIMKRNEDMTSKGKEGKWHFVLLKLVNSSAKKTKVAFLKLKFNKMKYERNQSLGNSPSKTLQLNNEKFLNNLDKCLSKKSSFLSSKEQSTLLINFPLKLSKYAGSGIKGEKKLIFLIERKTQEKISLALFLLRAFAKNQNQVLNKAEFILNLEKTKIVKTFGRGSIIVDRNEKLEDSSSFSAIPKKNQFSGYLSFGSLNNSLYENSKDSRKNIPNSQTLSRKAIGYLKGLNALKGIFFKKKSSILE